MRATLPLLLLSILPACPPPPQPGCTLENCRIMVDACSVEFQSFSLYCYTNTPPPSARFDATPYCVKACNATPGNGAIAECIAGKADACRAARDAGMFLDFSVTCADTRKLPQKACADQCQATLKGCDDGCTGGRTCDLCRRAGGACTDVCPDAGLPACADCSSRCNLDFFACTNACPRE